MSEQQDKKILLQLDIPNSQIWYEDHLEKITSEEMENIKTGLGDMWWTDTDVLEFATVYEDYTYSITRIKNVWDYRAGIYRKAPYKFTEPSAADAKTFADLCLAEFEKARQRTLYGDAGEIKRWIKNSYDGYVFNLNNMRRSYLSQTDWVFVEDSQVSAEDKELYRRYRQYLRDMTETEAWATKDYWNIDFPITPRQWKLRDPNAENEYLSVDDHFINHTIIKTKQRMLKFMQWLGAPGLDYKMDDINDMGYKEVKRRIDKYLARIDGELEFTINYKETPISITKDSLATDEEIIAAEEESSVASGPTIS